jgi:hypothetical protein
MNALRNLTLASAASVALALSDGTPVELVKVTSKDRLQVRIPTSHPLGAADPLRIFDRNGNHYKNQTDLKLVATPVDAAATTSAPAAPAAAQISANDNTVYSVGGNDFDTLEAATDEAIDIFADTRETVEIVATIRKVVGSVGIRLAA